MYLEDIPDAPITTRQKESLLVMRMTHYTEDPAFRVLIWNSEPNPFVKRRH